MSFSPAQPKRISLYSDRGAAGAVRLRWRSGRQAPRQTACRQSWIAAKAPAAHTRHIRLNDTELTEAVLNGATIYGPGDEKIGHVSEMHGQGAGAQVVVDVGGFLGIGANPVAVLARDLDFMRDESNAVHAVTRWTKDELKALPEHHH